MTETAIASPKSGLLRFARNDEIKIEKAYVGKPAQQIKGRISQ
jgi:hypothetical protein